MIPFLDYVLFLKFSGAAIGSSIAVVFKAGGDNYLKLTKRFLIGVIIGVLSAPTIIDYFELEPRPDVWLSSAAFGGLVGYLALQLIFNSDVKAMIKKSV
jgi:hypothetical protein